MKRLLFALCLLSPCFDVAADLNPSVALQRLIEGNKRYVDDKLLHPNRDQETREETENKQRPFATILGCSDSRVSPEILFDQGIGDIFVVRVAGNVAGPVEIDSIDYSALALGSSLVLVLGHENCGAVKAVVNRQVKGIASIASLIEPAVSLSRVQPGDPLKNAIEANIRETVKKIKSSPVVAELMSQGQIDVVGGYYDLGSGHVEILR